MILYPEYKDNPIILRKTNPEEEFILEGVIQSLSVNGEILIDSSNSVANQKSQKNMNGYKDKTVNISLMLVETDDKKPYEILADLETLFKDKQDNTPTVFILSNLHTTKRGIEKVLLTGLSSSEDNTTDTITVSLSFVEFDPAGY